MRFAWPTARLIYRASLIWLLAFSATWTARAQTGVNCTVSNTAMGVSCMASLGDYDGEQAVWILSSSDTVEIDTYAEASWINDQVAEMVYLVDLAGWIGQNSTTNQVKTGFSTNISTPDVSLTAGTNVGSTYSSNAQLILCFGTMPGCGDEGCGGGGGGGDCNPDDPDSCDCDYKGDCCQGDISCTQVVIAQPQLSLGFTGQCTTQVPNGRPEAYPMISVSITTGAPLILSLSPPSGTLGMSNQYTTVSGQNLVDAFGNSSVAFYSDLALTTPDPDLTGSVISPNPNNPSSVNVMYSIGSAAPLGNHYVTIRTNFGPSDPKPFTVVSPPTTPPPPSGPLPDPCAVTSNAQPGYSSIVSTGTPGDSGTMTVSFSGAAFAAISVTVIYGPYSTPNSIAANIAAMITSNYFRYGLSAKAFGPNIVYSGTSALGAVSVTGGSSFTTDPSAAAAAAAESSCDSAPPQRPSAIISMAFTGPRPQDNLSFKRNLVPCSEVLGPHTCPIIWDWNLEGKVIVTDDASKWTVNQQIVSGTFVYKFNDGSGILQTSTSTSNPGADGPMTNYLNQTAGMRTIFWIDSPGPYNTTNVGLAIDSGVSSQVFSVMVCSTVDSSICATKKWNVTIVVNPGGFLSYSLSSAKLVN